MFLSLDGMAGDTTSLAQRNSVRSIRMPCMIAASLWASATIAFFLTAPFRDAHRPDLWHADDGLVLK
jgi:hypothetical protein